MQVISTPFLPHVSLKFRKYRTLTKVLTTSISCADWKASYMFPWNKDKSLFPSRSINQASEFHCSCPGGCKVHLVFVYKELPRMKLRIWRLGLRASPATCFLLKYGQGIQPLRDAAFPVVKMRQLWWRGFTPLTHTVGAVEVFSSVSSLKVWPS